MNTVNKMASIKQRDSALKKEPSSSTTIVVYNGSYRPIIISRTVFAFIVLHPRRKMELQRELALALMKKHTGLVEYTES